MKHVYTKPAHFAAWLRTQVNREDEIGAMARQLPFDRGTFTDVLRYLEAQEDSENRIRAAQSALHEYYPSWCRGPDSKLTAPMVITLFEGYDYTTVEGFAERTGLTAGNAREALDWFESRGIAYTGLTNGTSASPDHHVRRYYPTCLHPLSPDEECEYMYNAGLKRALHTQLRQKKITIGRPI